MLLAWYDEGGREEEDWPRVIDCVEKRKGNKAETQTMPISISGICTKWVVISEDTINTQNY